MTEQEEFEFRHRLETERQKSMTHTESYQAKPQKATGAFTDFASGIVTGFKDIDRGIAQRQEDIKSWIGKGDPQNRQRLYDEEKRIANERAYDGNDTVLGMAGRGVARAIPAIGAMAVPGGQTIPTSTAMTGAMGALEGWMRPAESPGDSGVNAAVGAFGGATGNLASRAALPTIARNLDEPEKELLDIFNKYGIRARTSEVTGSTAIKNLETKAANRPFTAGSEKTFAREQTKEINQALTTFLGKPVSNLTDKELLSFGKNLGGEIGKYVDGKTVDLFDLAPAYVRLYNRAQEGGAFTMSPQAKKILDDTMSAMTQKQKMDAPTALRVKSRLRNEMNDAYKSDNTEKGDSLRMIVDGFDDALTAQMSATEKKGWEQARRRYSNYKIIEDAMERTPKAVADADIPIKKLASVMERNMPGSYAKGTGDFAELAKLGQKIDPPEKSALIGNGLPFGDLGRDFGRAALMPLLENKAAQAYLAGTLPGIKQIRDNKAATRALDTALRTAGLLSIEDWLE